MHGASILPAVMAGRSPGHPRRAAPQSAVAEERWRGSQCSLGCVFGSPRRGWPGLRPAM